MPAAGGIIIPLRWLYSLYSTSFGAVGYDWSLYLNLLALVRWQPFARFSSLLSGCQTFPFATTPFGYSDVLFTADHWGFAIDVVEYREGCRDVPRHRVRALNLRPVCMRSLNAIYLGGFGVAGSALR